jgi:type I restriction enzyme, S subunit
MSFLYFYMKFLFQPQFEGGTCGSAIPYIVLGDLKNFGIPYKSQLLVRYSQITKPLLKKWFDNQQENDCLTQLRDFLLPLLMNGQVTVKAIESKKDIIPFKNHDNNEQRFNQWLKNQGRAARGETDLKTLREIFDSMDDDDK